ncbi:MAG: FAD-binding protein, partial [Phycisphaerae bacterium]|nr:FAD-binding protein [Phycisphaerae bacterium]
MSVPLPVIRGGIEEQLRAVVRGQVRFDLHNRLLYSTDASIYQAEPIGIVLPIDEEDIAAVLQFALRHKMPLLPRGGGTSLAGQCTNNALVLDMSAMCRRIISIDAPNRRCIVEPGINLQELNAALIAHGLLFAPDPATIGQATIGGMIGNNAAGARSIKYGRTSENLAAIDVILTNGEKCTLRENAGRTDPIARRLAAAVGALVIKHANEIRQRFPQLVRRNAGYGLDLILQQLDRGVAVDDLDLSGLICGSEGTLAVITRAELKLHPIARYSGLAVASFSTLEEAIAATAAVVRTGASAVELIDDVVLTAAATNAKCATAIRHFPTIDGRPPRAALYVEYQSADSNDEIMNAFATLRATLPSAAICIVDDPQIAGELWTLRKSAEALLHALSSTRKPQTFVEDNSVPLARLGEFVEGFKRIVAARGTTAAFYAHASVGVLHVRPMIDLHKAGDRQRMRDIAIEVAELARSCGGVMSGEHGDGRVRGPLLEKFFGPQITEAFADLKRIFDPAGILNPGMIVDAGPIESITNSLRVDREMVAIQGDTYFDYGDQGGFGGAVEMCNGAGFCRKTIGNTMCPSYRATLDERHSTRGRGNALRLALSGQFGDESADRWSDPGTIETLDLCLSCKACKSECPSSVDMARLKAEYTGQRYRLHRPPLSARVFGRVRLLNRLGSYLPELSNFIAEQPPLRLFVKRVLGIAPERQLPRFGPALFRWVNNRIDAGAMRPPAPGSTTVVLFGDCFTAFNESHIGRAAIHVLEALGFRVNLVDAGCCGRAMISMGLMDQARIAIDRTIARLDRHLQHGEKLLVCEPSCLSAIKDDWLQLKLSFGNPLRRYIADQSMLVEQFVAPYLKNHPLRDIGPTLLHGHCHQKALWGARSSGDALKHISRDVTTLDSGCCGMAGSFGFHA